MTTTAMLSQQTIALRKHAGTPLSLNRGYYWTQDATTTANCLINLHYTQSDACISVAGSSCKAGKGTSQILNTHIGSAYKLNSDESNTLQAASNNMIGRTVSSGDSDDSGESVGYVSFVRDGPNVPYSSVIIVLAVLNDVDWPANNSDDLLLAIIADFRRGLAALLTSSWEDAATCVIISVIAYFWECTAISRTLDFLWQ